MVYNSYFNEKFVPSILLVQKIIIHKIVLINLKHNFDPAF